jgi:glycerol-3-phosphate dehydrogenase (NAD(P)+)
LAKLLADKGQEITLWCHGAESFRDIAENRENRAYLPAIALPATIKATQSIRETVLGKRLIVIALPSHVVREVLTDAATTIDRRTMILCGTKGLEEETAKTMGALLLDLFGSGAQAYLAFLSGPTFAVEVARELPAAVTVAAFDLVVAKSIQELLSTQSFRVYTSADVIGVQMGGVIKNVIAIAAGISDGLSLGQNARAALITRGLAEMTRLAVRMGADPLTLAGLPGLGDLILTCAGDLSRNRAVGLQIARGKAVKRDNHCNADDCRGRAQYPHRMPSGRAAAGGYADRRANGAGALWRKRASERRTGSHVALAQSRGGIKLTTLSGYGSYKHLAV